MKCREADEPSPSSLKGLNHSTPKHYFYEMSTYTQIIYQIVFSTKNRKKSLSTAEKRKEVFKYIWGVLKNKKCHLYRINGVEDHIHIVTHLHPTIALSSLVKDIKLASSSFIKNDGGFPLFEGWQQGYAAFTYAYSAKDALIEYVKRQEEHHKTVSFKEELISLLQEHQIPFNEKYLL
jgi:putative transposase